MVTSQITRISRSTLQASDKWLVNYFLSQEKREERSGYDLVKLEDLVEERSDTIDPQRHAEWHFAYIGLENIEANTGFVVGFEKKPGKSIKSRSKIFYGGDLLYGRLRPTLNKVLLVDKSFGGGICSTEIFVLKVNEEKISPIVLRFLLSTEFVLDQIKSYVAGAALPRIHVSDFMSIQIPLIEHTAMLAMEKELIQMNNDLLKARNLCANSSLQGEDIFEKYFAGKKNTVQSNDGARGLKMFEGTLPLA